MIQLDQKSIERPAPQWHMGTLFRWHATGRETGGAYALAEIEVRAGSEPPPHTHTHEEESFFVLDGTIDFFIDGQARTARAGDLVVLPRGKTHGFLVQSGQARALMLISPAGLEDAFLATSEPAPIDALPPPPSGPPPREAIERVLSIHAEHGVRFDVAT